jgi:Protein of unknown function (DUF1329)
VAFAVGASDVIMSLAPGAQEESAALGSSDGAESTRIMPKRSGFEGLEIRPQFHSFRVLGTQDVLAPINAVKPAYPADSARDFGPYGLSWASDRWDLRRALVLESVPRAGLERGDPELARSVVWLDLQTLYPLYYASYDAKGEPIDVGYYVGRWSESERVVDRVGQAFANLRLRASWRRESWQVVSTPESDGKARQAISLKNLNKGR